MIDVILKLENIGQKAAEIKPLIANDSLAIFRRELELAKNLTGLNHETVARSYGTNPDNFEEVLYAVWLTDWKREQILLVHVRFPHIDVFENAAQWHQSTHLNPIITYQANSNVDALFKKHMENREAL